MEDMLKIENIVEIAELIDEHKGDKTLVLDVRKLSSWTDYFVITTVSSQGHMRGMLRHLREHLSGHGAHVSNKHKQIKEDGWILIDCGSVVIHLMDQEVRDFYELEKLWFSASICYQSSKSS